MTGTGTIDSVSMSWTPAPSAASTLAAPEAWFLNFATGNPLGEPGPAVNEFTAFNYLQVYSCVSLIASKIAELPLVTYRTSNGGRNRTRATDRSEYDLLLTEFNAETCAMIGREAGLAHLLTWGNSYTQIVRNKSGSKVLQLRVLGPDVVRPVRQKDGGVLYDVYQRGTAQLLARLDPEEVLHVPGLSFDGLIGYSPIRVARSAIRAGMAQDQGAERFVTRGIRPPGAIKFRQGQRFKDEQDAIQYRDRFRRIHSVQEGDLQVLVLEDGAEWQQLGVDPKSAQLLDSRKYSRKEICGMYRVPPFMIGDVDSSTSWGTGLAQQQQGFIDYCLMGWVRRVECEYKRKLARDDPDVYYRHQVEELLRGDLLTRTQARQIQHQRGIITDNEWRLDEHLDAVEGGDVRHSPLNERLIDEAGEPVDGAPPAPEPSGPPTPPDVPTPPAPGQE
jgi:HK97 family phage portal protein